MSDCEEFLYSCVAVDVTGVVLRYRGNFLKFHLGKKCINNTSGQGDILVEDLY